MTPEDITIAVTVYDRRTFLHQAVQSAVGQSPACNVMVVEDCGPDAGMRDFVESRFGNRVRYFRSPRRRGIFGNWNTCIEHCKTPWLSILHDDDFLEDGFVQAMLELSGWAPGRNLYFGQTRFIDFDGRELPSGYPDFESPWRELDPRATATTSPFPFPGQLMRVESARAIGGFREASQYCGDWELWFRLALQGGAAQTRRRVATVREHSGFNRGTTRVQRRGSVYALVAAHRKRCLAELRRNGINASFDRSASECQEPWVSRLLMRNAHGMGDRMLRYNLGVLRHSTQGRPWMRGLRLVAPWAGPGAMRWISRCFVLFLQSGQKRS
jgi:glycosyltransferase involved in cell wall biosynthesis